MGNSASLAPNLHLGCSLATLCERGFVRICVRGFVRICSSHNLPGSELTLRMRRLQGAHFGRLGIASTANGDSSGIGLATLTVQEALGERRSCIPAEPGRSIDDCKITEGAGKLSFISSCLTRRRNCTSRFNCGRSSVLFWDNSHVSV